jgi:ABC-2 type transport system permease protein
MPIFDQGYQHWEGHLAGHAWRWLAITRHGMRTSLSTRYVRPLILIAWIPALLLVGVLAVWGMIEQGVEGAESWLPFLTMLAKASDVHGCRQAVWTIAFTYFFRVELYLVMLIVTLCGPNLISRDLRFNALPLYLSRPMTRNDYFLGKLGVIATLVAAVALIPAALSYVLGVCFSLDLSVVRDTWRLLPASIAYGMLIVVSAGTLMLAMSSMSRRSLYVGLAWIGMWLISSTVAVVLGQIHKEMIERDAWQTQARADSFDGTRPQAPGARGRRGYYGNNQALQEALADAAKTDWRPLFSYAANLDRIGEACLDTDTAWVKIARAMNSSGSRTGMVMDMSEGRWPTERPPLIDERYFADQNVPQYPWTWSAGVLAGLFGLSLWILSTRVRSLDRLR